MAGRTSMLNGSIPVEAAMTILEHPDGTASCGVKRQWCGRLGKVDNCQQGYFLAYAAKRGCALVDARLYLPADWAADPTRRLRTHVPADVAFQEGWRIALGLLDRARAG